MAVFDLTTCVGKRGVSGKTLIHPITGVMGKGGILTFIHYGDPVIPPLPSFLML